MIPFLFDVILDRPFPTERRITLCLEGNELIPLDCKEDLEYLFKHISPRHLKRTVKDLGLYEEKFTLGLVIIRRK